MNIYKYEIVDGLQPQLEANASIAMECKIVKTFISKEVSNEIKKTIAALCPSNPDQADLYYVNSILVSDGWNKNKDVFAKEYLFAAKDTPADKPFNYMHDESDILGHITGSMVLNAKGEEASELPKEDFDIVISSVIYKAWSDPEKSERINKLIAEIEDGKWSVSMECMFNDFDYAVITPEGQEKVVIRNDESSFLTKHLSVYGGKGEYEGYKLGRLLKNISFTGVGLVDKPANPRSIILSKDLNPFKGGNVMAKSVAEETVDPVKDLTEKLEGANKTLADKDQLLVSKDALIQELQDALAQSKVESNEKEDKMKKMHEEMQKDKKEVKNMKRKALLVEAGVTSDKVDEILAKWDAADDGMFDSVVALIKEKTPTQATETEEIEVEAVEETEAALNDAGDTQTSDEKAVAFAIEWFAKNALNTTKEKK